jgi:hypothetical protein
VTLLRSVGWLSSQGVLLGGLLHLDMAEMGSVGWARVMSVECSPELEEGEAEFPTKNGRGVKDYATCSYSTGDW